MATVSTSRRSAAGIALIVAGALFLLAVLLPLADISLPWLTGVAYLAVGLALAILAVGAVNNNIAKVTLGASAIGWLVLGLNALTDFIPGGLVTAAALVAGIGGLIAAIVLYVGKEITNTAALVFILTTVLGLLYLLDLIGTFSLATLGTVVTILFGAALVATGLLFRTKMRRR